MQRSTVEKLFVGGLVAIIGGSFVILGLTREREPLPPSALEWDESLALVRCQDAILARAEFGDVERPPPVRNHGRGDEFYFAWPSGSFHFVNGFGAKVPMSASCIGSRSRRAITSLTINGQQHF